MIEPLFDLTLSALILATALASVTGQQIFRSVTFFIVYGILIAMAWLRLGAVDVALVEAAIGAGLTGVLLLGALGRLKHLGQISAASLSIWFRVAMAFAAAGVSLGISWAFMTLPEPVGLQAAVGAQLAISGAENPVTAVLLNFRAWDTLLESVVLLVALIGVWSLAQNEDWGIRAGLPPDSQPDEVLTNFARILPPVGLLVGVYLVWAGSSQPGGAFQGGTILAAMALLIVMAGLMAPPRVESATLRLILVLGPAVFLAIALAGALSGQFLTLPPAMAKALILGIEVFLMLSIAATLMLLVLGPPESKAKQG